MVATAKTGCVGRPFMSTGLFESKMNCDGLRRRFFRIAYVTLPYTRPVSKTKGDRREKNDKKHTVQTKGSDFLLIIANTTSSIRHDSKEETTDDEVSDERRAIFLVACAEQLSEMKELYRLVGVGCAEGKKALVKLCVVGRVCLGTQS